MSTKLLSQKGNGVGSIILEIGHTTVRVKNSHMRKMNAMKRLKAAGKFENFLILVMSPLVFIYSIVFLYSVGGPTN